MKDRWLEDIVSLQGKMDRVGVDLMEIAPRLVELKKLRELTAELTNRILIREVVAHGPDGNGVRFTERQNVMLKWLSGAEPESTGFHGEWRVLPKIG